MQDDLTSRGSPPFFVSRCQLKKLEYNRKIRSLRRFQIFPVAPLYPRRDAQIQIMKANPNLLLGLEVVEEDGALLGLFTPVLDDDARAVDDLAGVTLTVQHACLPVSPRPPPISHPSPRGNSQRPAHSPSCLPSGTLIRGILCSEQRAMTSFL